MVGCALCGLSTAHPLIDEAGRAFCCPSCREVDRLLSQPVKKSEIQTAESQQSTIQSPNSEVTLSLGGLWCSSCAWLVNEGLRRAPGVQDVEISFVQREARITFDPDQIDTQRCIRRVRQLGYRAWLPGDTPYDEEDAHWQRLIIGGASTLR